MGRVKTSKCVSNLEVQVSLNSKGEGPKQELGEAGQGAIREGRLSVVSKNEDLGQI